MNWCDDLLRSGSGKMPRANAGETPALPNLDDAKKCNDSALSGQRAEWTSEQAAGFRREDVQRGFQTADGFLQSGMTIEFGAEVLQQAVCLADLLLGIPAGLFGWSGRMRFHDRLRVVHGNIMPEDQTTKDTKGHEGCCYMFMKIC